MEVAVGRLTKFNVEIANKIIGAVRSGASLAIAAQVAGIGRSTLYDWLTAGDRDDANPDLAGFTRDVREGLAHVDGAVEQSLMRKATHGDDWRAALAVLKIRRPDDWNPDLAELARVETFDRLNELCPGFGSMVKSVYEKGEAVGDLMEFWQGYVREHGNLREQVDAGVVRIMSRGEQITELRGLIASAEELLEAIPDEIAEMRGQLAELEAGERKFQGHLDANRTELQRRADTD